MTPYTILIGIISLAICFLPFYLAYRNQKKTQNALISAIHEMAEKNNSQIGDLSLSSIFSIGISSDERYLFYFQKDFISEDETEKRVVISLGRYIKCKSEVVMRNNRSPKDPDAITERMSLVFYPLLRSKDELVIDFFNIDKYFMPNGELNLLKTWELKINSILEKNRPPVKIKVMRNQLKRAS